MVVPCAQLRVFVPRDTLPPRDRERWADAGQLGLGEARLAEDRVTASRMLTGRGDVSDGAVLVRRLGDVELVCPLGFDLRSAMALQQLRDSLPQPVVEMLVPDRSLRDQLDLVAATGRRPSIVDAPWAVPLAWFLLVDDAERRLLDPPEGVGPRLLYATTVSAATQRLARAVDAVDDTVHGADQLLVDLADLAEWLHGFDPRSLVELDYGGLAALLGRDRLEVDHSARDAWEVVVALEAGDTFLAATRQATLRARWSRHRSLVSAS